MERVKTGIPGLDQMLRGGLLRQTVTLVEGAPGTGKTTLGMQFIYHGIVVEEEPGIILTFEQFPSQYYRDAANFGWDFRRLEEEGKLRIIMTSPEVSRAYLEEAGGEIEKLARRMNARRILVDSVSHFERLAENPIELRQTIYGFINGLKREELTGILTRESAALLGEAEGYEENIPFVVDNYVLLRYVEIESAIHKALLVLKMRGSDHDKDIRRFTISDEGINVQSRFEGREGIMSGSPRRMAHSFIEAFVKR
ncbi:MAG: ATPase domain-containing protein [Anaerolineae bacterium]|jgi:circadian clock protein KaiC